MVSRFIARVIGRGGDSSVATPRRRRPRQKLAAAAGLAIEAMESRVLLSTLYVDASAPGPDYDGASWATAYTDLQLALGAASAGDEIRIADGTYKPTSTADRTISFALRDGVAICGGYAGYGAADPDARDIAAYPTILSGDIGAAGTKTDNSYHVLTANGVGASTVLDGVTVTGGYANGSGANQSYGGGLLVTDASPTLTNSTFIGNSAVFGGGMYNAASSPTLTNCTFSENSTNVNTSNGRGGGMYNHYSSPTLTNCSFSGNLAVGSSSASGGGMCNLYSSPTLIDCAFSGNASNAAIGQGGGMYNDSSSSPSLANCAFIGNSASHNGGGILNFSASSSPRLTNCIIWKNSANNAGGGIYNNHSSPTITSCTISANSANSGGGIYNASSSSPTLTNCIVWGNTNGAIYNNSSTSVVTYSNIQGGYAGVGNINADPLFARSPWTGPDGRFGTADDDPGDLHLREGSPALDSGSNAAVAGVSSDLAGNARIQNGTLDMGAYEGSVHSNILYVDVAAGGADTGVSWADAFTSVQSALAAAGTGDIIRIADGVYRPMSTTDRTLGFALRDGVTVYGGYAGYGAPDPDARDISLYPTILSGDIGAPGSNADNSYHVVTATGVGSSTVLDGVFITGGNASGTGANQSYGGGVFVTGSSPMLINCTFIGNLASSSGGAMYNAASSSPIMVNCTFTGNVASGTLGMGGAIFNASSSPKLTNCTFIGNSAGSGGVMSNASSSAPTLTNCTLVGNSAGSGSAMHNASSSSPKLTNCIVWGNTNGVIYSISSTPVVTYSVIQGGYAGIGNIFSDPGFVRSPWTGPDGVFGTADDDPGELRLRHGSPALDAGSNAAVSGISTDLAGNARIQNGMVDMGIYEGPIAVAPKILYVDAAAGGTNIGVSWADAFPSLQSALAVAAGGDIIRMADGSYRPTDTTDRTHSFVLRDRVAIYGGYAGYGAADPDARDVVAYPTILSGDIGTPESNADNSYHVLTANGLSAFTLLHGIIVAAGNANGTGTNQYGGGLYATGSSLTLVNCTFSGNSANSGGGMYSVSSAPTLTSCTFNANSAAGSGGSGGGMYNASSSPKLTNCTFSGNSANYNGGGMVNTTSSSPTLIHCTFSSNSAGSGGGSGGGLYNSSSSPTLINCAFSGNSASSNGGGVYNVSASPKLTNCTFSGNWMSAGGGSGGGMANRSSSSPTLTNCTFTGNAATFGGAVFNDLSSPTLTNCILWGNTASTGPQIRQSGGTLSVTYSDIQGGYSGVGNIDVDPLLVRNPSPGLDGLWNGIDDDHGDLRLQPNSPCVDASNSAAAGLAGITTDMAGRPRFVDIALAADTGAGMAPIVDMGAYEVQWRAPGWLDVAGVAVWDVSTYSLDIGSQTLLVAADDVNRAERLEAVRRFIAAGRSGGAGIVSSAAGEDQAVIAALDGGGNILVRVALMGDVTLDDQLDGDDYFALDRAFLAGGGHAPEADLDVDGVIDGRDYFVLDARSLKGVGVQALGAVAVQVAQRPSAGVFSGRSIVDEVLMEEEGVLLGV